MKKHFQNPAYQKLLNSKRIFNTLLTSYEKTMQALKKHSTAMNCIKNFGFGSMHIPLYCVPLQAHTVRNLHFLSQNSTLISRENCRFFGVKNS